MTPETRGNAKPTIPSRWIGRAAVPTDEQVLLDLRPSPWMIPLNAAVPIIIVSVVVFALAWTADIIRRSIATNPPPFDWQPIYAALGLVVALILIWNLLDYLTRRYVLTTSRALLVFGILNQRIADLPRERLQNAAVLKPFVLRLLGLGHVGLASAGTDGYEIVWRFIRAPERIIGTLRDRAAPSAAPRPILIGLAGGVGSGKSTVARLFEDLGCVVVDSDALSRAAIQQPEVRSTLRKWWGEDVFTGTGEVDRSAVAKIVFQDEDERRRLESLIHPLIEAERAARIEQARNAGVRAVVVDAPLLFEAGLEKEMDTVVFVDSPFEVRLERVQRTRGWDEQELHRREKAQMALEEKRNRSDHTVVNAGDLDDLRRQVSQVFTRITEAKKAV